MISPTHINIEDFKAIIADQFCVSAGAILLSDRFYEDLSADSMVMVELVLVLEEEMGVRIPDTVAERVRTVGGLWDYVNKCKEG